MGLDEWQVQLSAHLRGSGGEKAEGGKGTEGSVPLQQSCCRGTELPRLALPARFPLPSEKGE